MINANQHNCTGCGACIASCPQKCIHMKYDLEGFIIPVVDVNRCVNCNLCDKVCPEKKEKKVSKDGDVYAFKNNDLEIRLKSSSGGVFFSVAKKIIENKGVVCGALFDNDLRLIHKCTSELSDVAKMMGSKYVQSYIGDVYSQIKGYLNSDREVLFVGTPCQVAGLKSFLNGDYDNLFTIQLICHGVPSPLLFEKYKEYLCKKHSMTRLDKISFRDNNRFKITITCEDEKKSWQGSTDLYLRPFIKGKNYRYCCYNCLYSQNHIADITIGDFWGAEKYYKDLCDSHGISFFMVNTKNGEKMFKNLENITTISSDYDIASKHNSNLNIPSKIDADREDFYKDINKSNYIESLRKYVPLSAVIASKLPKRLIEIIQVIIDG